MKAKKQSYRSRATCEAIYLAPSEDDPIGEEVIVPAPQGELRAQVGDYVVFLPDRNPEIWAAESFEAEYEPAAAAAPGRARRLEVAP